MATDVQTLIHTLPNNSGAVFGAITTLQQVADLERWNTLPGEMRLAAPVAHKTLTDLGPDARIDRLIYLNSVPIQVPHMGGFALAEAVDLVPSHVVDIGNHCAAMLDGLWLATTLWKDNANLLVAPTELGKAVSKTMWETKPGSRQWCDGAAAVVLGGEGERFFRPLSYVSCVEPNLQSMLDVCPKNGGYEYDFKEDVADRFRAVDLDNELLVIREALAAAECDGSALAGIIVVNRGRRRTELLAPAFGVDAEMVTSSRLEIGHGGGADILFNLDRLLSQLDSGTHRVALVGNGLGYVWSAMVVEIETS